MSGLLTREPDAPTAVILDGMIAGRFPFLLSLDLLAEYRAVLLRPSIRRRHQLSEAQIDALLTEVTMNGVVRNPRGSSSAPPDPGDQHVWALLESNSAAALVTGDGALFEHALDRSRVLSPRSFLARLARSSG